MERNRRWTLTFLGLAACLWTSLALAQDVQPLEDQTPADGASEETLSLDPMVGGYAQVPCAIASIPRKDVEDVEEGEPVQSSNPNCICPHAGPGWNMTGDSCTLSADGATCSGQCYWEDPIQMIGTATPCGTP